MTTPTATANAPTDSTVADSAASTGATPATDVIDQLLGADQAGVLADIRAARPDARTNAQRSFEALFVPVDVSDVSLAERFAVAAFATGLHGEDVVGPFYAAGYAAHESDSAITNAVAAEITAGRTEGPYGEYRESDLKTESTGGLRYSVSAENTALLDARLTAALEHTHLLVFRPREATPEALDALLAAGWSATGIVTLSQLVAFLAFQLRVVHGLSQLASSIQNGTNR
ncbi:MAG: hypothetical protein JWQ43_1101 [Glaciihabitans sp.]|nr:hypothetical protein [Glaciihabitans sp.]